MGSDNHDIVSYSILRNPGCLHCIRETISIMINITLANVSQYIPNIKVNIEQWNLVKQAFSSIQIGIQLAR